MSERQTPETNAEANRQISPMMGIDEWTRAWGGMASHAIKLERERDEARSLFESSKAARQSLSDACDHLQRELDNAKRERDNSITDAKQWEVDCIRALQERNEAREQRDQLANAIRAFMTEFENGNGMVENLADTLFDSLKVLQGGGK